jgi:Putative transposase/Transposase zinc-binding domain
MLLKEPIKQPIKQILIDTQDVWDNDGTRPCVRESFRKMIECGTRSMGWQIYASETEVRYVYHRCKNRSCPSCGYRATLEWQREQWTQLPDVPYSGLVFTMPGTLWRIFKENRHLLYDLPTLGGEAILQWMKDKYDAVPLVLVVTHTFGRHLNFNTHLHMLVSAGGFLESENRWLTRLSLNPVGLMKLWRHAVITYLRLALEAGILKSDLENADFAELLADKYDVDWKVLMQAQVSKRHFLGYAARYIRRPPIAQHRFRKIDGSTVTFVTKDTATGETVLDEVPKEHFIKILADQAPDKFRHSIRYYGLLAPRSRNRAFTILYALLGQKRARRPRRLSWAEMLQRYFNRNPLLDSRGERMRFVGRHFPAAA